MYDVIIIGAGVSGCSIARELSRYKLDILVLEKEEDVCSGTSKANSAIVHAGFDAKPGTLMAKLNVEGNRLMPVLAKDLGFEYINNGSLVVCTSKEDLDSLEELKARGIANGVTDLRILNKEEVNAMEPNIGETVEYALYAPTAGIVDPFGLTIALAENAYDNGVRFEFNSAVEKIDKTEFGYSITADGKKFDTKLVINAAGVYADRIHNMVSSDKMTIIPRRGDYLLLDKSCGSHIKNTIFAVPGKHGEGKGVLVSPTVHGNLIVGPTSVDLDEASKDANNTTASGLSDVIEKSKLNVKNIPYRMVITSFAGLRATEHRHDFLIGELPDAKGFIDCAAIQSPGLTASPAIGIYTADIAVAILNPEKKDDFKPTRKGFTNPRLMSDADRDALIKNDPSYGRIVCRCEGISEGEILEAIRRPVGAKSMDGVKRRVRAGMGRCQAGFCTPRIIELLSKELGKAPEEICKNSGNSNMLSERGRSEDALC